MTFSEETLMQYVDGELDADTRSAVDAAIASDPQVAEKVERQRTLRLSLQRTFDAVLVEPVPQRLLDAARSAPAGASAAIVADLASARTARAKAASRLRLPRVSWPQGGVIAASVLLGLIVGQLILSSRDAGPFVMRGGELMARGALAGTLSSQLALDQPQNAALQVGVSFRARGGTYCRTFTLHDHNSARAFAGLACNASGRWQIEVLAPATSIVSGDYRMAGSGMPNVVMQVLEATIAGEPLDAAGERAAREHGWRP